MDARALEALLRKDLAGTVSLDGEPVSRDFGRVLHHVPKVVVRPADEADIAHCFRVAASAGVPVVFRGAGHTCAGQALSDGGILIESFVDRAEVTPVDDTHVEVTARSSWRRVESALNERGRAVPVLTDYQDLAVGGTLSVGGCGFHSISRGLQVDHVARARVLLPDGTAAWCSPEENAELFRFALAGLGQVGYVSRVVLATVPHNAFTSLWVCSYESLGALLGSLEWMLTWGGEWPSELNAVAYQGQVMAFYGLGHADATAAGAHGEPAFVERLPGPVAFQHTNYRTMTYEQTVDWLGTFPDHEHLWADYVFDYDGARRFVELVETLRARDAFGGCLEVVHLYVIRRPRRRTVFAFEGPGARDGLTLSVGFYTMLPPGDAGARARVRAALAECLARCVALGGRPYLYGWYELDEATRRGLYGDDWTRFLALRARHDPHGVLGPPKI
jgi:FAD/FMN-containing dehydrogenase